MDEELRKIDVLRERMGISYREAKEALEEAGGDLVRALVSIEEKMQGSWTDKLIEKGEELAGQVKTCISKGNRTKVRLKRGRETLAEFPATLGALGAVAALVSTPVAIAAGIGAVAAIANNVAMEIEKPDGQTRVISMNRQGEQ